MVSVIIDYIMNILLRLSNVMVVFGMLNVVFVGRQSVVRVVCVLVGNFLKILN